MSRRLAAFQAAFAASLLGLGGCVALPEGYSNWADLWGDSAGFCGYLQECGDHKDREEDRAAAAVRNDESTTGDSGTGEPSEPPGDGAGPPAGE